MVEVKSLIDGLTLIHNEEFLRQNYKTYLEKNPNSNFVMIDFEKFKSINDLYGHNVGDEYLKIFAKILSKNFEDSLVVRLHGDEFSVLTKFSEDEIAKKFYFCNEDIKKEVVGGKIPSMFRYNAGSTAATEDIDFAKEKADYMMYHAKNHRKIYQPYCEYIYQKKIDQDSFLAKIDDCIKNNKFTYALRQLHDIKSNPIDMFRVFTRDNEGNSLLDNGRYEILKKSNKLLQFDNFIIKDILDSVRYFNGKIIITMDHKSLFTADELPRYLLILKDIVHMSFDNIILSIDLSMLLFNNYNRVIDSVNKLKKFGFNVCLEKIDSNVGDVVFENTSVDYVMFCSKYWNKAKDNDKANYLLIKKIEMFDKFDGQIIPVFGHIDNEDDFSFIKSITSNNTLFGGNYFSKERKLILKR